MSTIPEVVRKRLDAAAQYEHSLQHPNFTIGLLSFHLPQHGLRDAHGSWSVDGLEYDFRLYGQISGHQTFLGPYGDMIYHKAKPRYVGPWIPADATRAKKKISLVLPDTSDDSPHSRTLTRQYEFLRDLQQQNFEECTADLPGDARCSSGFVIRMHDRWRLSAVTENIFSVRLPNGHDAVPLGPQHDPQGIVSKLKLPNNDSFLVRELSAVDSTGSVVSPSNIPDVFRPGTWVELYCKLRVWIRTEGGVQVRSYHVVFDAVQLLCTGTVKETVVGPPLAVNKRKRTFSPVDSCMEKRVRLDPAP